MGVVLAEGMLLDNRAAQRVGKPPTHLDILLYLRGMSRYSTSQARLFRNKSYATACDACRLYHADA